MNAATTADALALTLGAQIARAMLARCLSGEQELDLIEATDMVTMRHRDWSDLADALKRAGHSAEWAARSGELTLVASRAVLATLATA